jgi:3-isopropylmalate dehydrogenase
MPHGSFTYLKDEIVNIAVLPGDGIGPEVTKQAVRVLKALDRHGLRFEFTEAPIGVAAYRASGSSLPDATFKIVEQADAILFGAVGGYQEDALPRGARPGDALLHLRKALGLYANFRPVVMFPELIGASTLKPEVVRGLDIIILRELTGDIYFGEPRHNGTKRNGRRIAVNTMIYDEDEIARVAHSGFRSAQGRKRKLCSVDKANVLETSELWRNVVTEVGHQYPEVELTHMYVDAAAMALLRRPSQFDVMLAANLFGDILSDEAAMLTGSIGMLPSCSVGDGKKGLYEPVHGSAPDIAGKNVANPLAAILSAAMMLRHTFGLSEAADKVERAVRAALAKGYRTADLEEPGSRIVGTDEMGAAVAEMI